MIADEKQLQYTYESLAKMYRLRDADAQETAWDPSLRANVVESTEAMIRKLEAEVADFLARRKTEAA